MTESGPPQIRKLVIRERDHDFQPAFSPPGPQVSDHCFLARTPGYFRLRIVGAKHTGDRSILFEVGYTLNVSLAHPFLVLQRHSSPGFNKTSVKQDPKPDLDNLLEGVC